MVAMTTKTRPPRLRTRLSSQTRAEFRRVLRLMRADPVRTIREFAESELVTPKGPLPGSQYSAENQPVQALLLDEYSRPEWRRFIVTGPAQTGKTFVAFIIPLLYHLFEMGETVVCGVPDLNMVHDKWTDDILPVLEMTRYRHLLPRSGEGSRGGKVESAVHFTNGATLRFMTGGSSDKARAGFSARVLLVTEAELFDVKGGTSKEGTKLSQLEARTRAFATRRVYIECTVTTEKGLMEREYALSSEGRVMLPCPHCRKYVRPRRENLHGWQEATTAMDAMEAAFIACPGCGAAWTEAERVEANKAARLCHRGQSVDDDGQVVGELPRSDTLGYRWDAVNNMFQPMGEVGRDEWLAKRDGDPEAAETSLRQFVWCLPVKATAGTLSERAITSRQCQPNKGIVPPWARKLTVGIDVGKWFLHWTAIAWGADGRCHVVAYGSHKVNSNEHAEEVAIMQALRELRDMCEAGWLAASPSPSRPDLAVIDAGNWQDVVVAFAKESGKAYVASKGRGVTQYGTGRYHDRKAATETVPLLGDGWHLAILPEGRGQLLEFDTDRWKTWLHARLDAPRETAGAMSLHAVSNELDHLDWARAIMSEQRVTVYVPKRGNVDVWERVKGQNHYLDSSTLACVGAGVVGVTVIDAPAPQTAPIQPPRPSTSSGFTMPDGRPFLPTQRGRE